MPMPAEPLAKPTSSAAVPFQQGTFSERLDVALDTLCREAFAPSPAPADGRYRIDRC